MRNKRILKCLLVIIVGILLSGCITEENKVKNEKEIGSTDNPNPTVASSSPLPTPSLTTDLPTEEGVPTFKIGSWKVISRDTTPKISIRFSTSDTTTIDLIGPDGIPTDSVKYEIIKKPSKLIGESVELKLGEPLIIPQIGTYKLIATQNEKEVFVKEFVFKGPKVDVTEWEPHYKYVDGKLKIDYLNIFMKNSGDLPIYFKRVTRLIAGGDRITSSPYLKDIKIEPNTDIMILSTEDTSIFDLTLPLEDINKDELTIWIEDTSKVTHKFSGTVDPQKYID